MRQAILPLAVAGTLGAQSPALDLNGRAVDVPGSAASRFAALIFIGAGDDSAQAIGRYRAECGYSIVASRDRQGPRAIGRTMD